MREEPLSAVTMRLAWHVLYSYGWSPQVFSGTSKTFFFKINKHVFWEKNTGTGTGSICTKHRVAFMTVNGKGVPSVTKS